jgi:hypothetical protein
LGLKFTSEINGYVAGVRFYKGAGNTGTHMGHLWTAGGTLLASVTFSNETGSGWQQALFSTPIPIDANTTYVVSYFAPSGHFSLDSGYFASSGFGNYPLQTPAAGPAGGNGVYRGGSSGFPTSTAGGANYWVDLVFSTTGQDSVAPTVTSRTPAPGATGVSFQPDVTATFSEAVTPSSISFVLKNASNVTVASTVTYDAPTRTVTLHPNSVLPAGATFTATLSGATDPSGNAMTPISWSFTTVSCPCSIWAASATPSMANYPDSAPVELGLKFRADVNGFVTGVRFYKGPGNTGTHTGKLWTSSGTLLASVTFTNETSTGWQQALFATPVAVTAGTTYIVSYFAPNGNFALNSGFFLNAGVLRYPLRALQSGLDGGNGVFKYGPASTFPTDANGGNYWVDVVFTP